jgi:hypothetical protein
VNFIIQEIIGGGALQTFGCDLNSESFFLNSQRANGARVKEFGMTEINVLLVVL